MRLRNFLKSSLETKTTRNLRDAIRPLIVACALAVTGMTSLPTPAHSQAPAPGEQLMLQNMASQGWISRYYDYSNQMYTFFFTVQHQTWVFSPQGTVFSSGGIGYHITSPSRDVAIMPLPNNYFEWAPVVGRTLPSVPGGGGYYPSGYFPNARPENIWEIVRVQGNSQWRFQLKNAYTGLCLAAGWAGPSQPFSELRLNQCNAIDARQLFAIWNPSTGQYKQ